ncbi:hypothetical protein [Vibrio chagasii]|uniref:hypothetical protein n=1 Tax=Vibrio chagasii TaxID=170679 RepID=UPI002284035B|nr:hypothetical protein [Vibrio chagasii]MCY9827883.1 hypothetical protein [Vibrio chagasii]
MSSYRYLELIKKSTEDELIKYIRIIEAEMGYNETATNLNNYKKSQLELTLKELISKSLRIERENLDYGNLSEREEYKLGNYIDELFSQSRDIRYEFGDQIGWLDGEPRALYFFLVIVHTVVSTGNTNLFFPVTEFSLNLSRRKYLLRDTDYLTPLTKVCPNKNLSAYDNLVRALEIIITSRTPREQQTTYRLLRNIERLYETVFINRNVNKKAFKSDDAELISWYYRALITEFPNTGLSVTEDTDKQKHTIMCIFDVLCATTEPDMFTKLEDKLVEKFLRRKRDKEKGKALKTTKEEKTLTFSEADWEKLAVISGGHSKNQIKAKLKELIDIQLEKVKDETATNSVNTDEDNIKNVTNDSSEKHESIHD